MFLNVRDPGSQSSHDVEHVGAGLHVDGVYAAKDAPG
jgi:hypothetical protein